ncbi:MAG: MFS transporter [Bifidobacteriaceae bacterium]|jgi:MFS family permease|nr:MFS transporter [Bifidobacteriaceae bacterium]
MARTGGRGGREALAPGARPVIFACVLCSFLTAFTGSSLNVSIPSIGADFGSPAASLGWVVSAYTICTVVLLAPLGRLADLTSRRSVLIAGLATLAAVAVATAFAVNLPQLIALRVAQGVGASCVFATQQAILAQAVPPFRRGWALGLSVGAVYCGLSLGPVVGGLLTHHWGWRSIFWFIAVLGLVALTVAVVRLPREGRHRAGDTEAAGLWGRLDVAGAAIYAAAGFGLCYGMMTVPGRVLGYVALAAGLALLGVFVWWEHRAVSPLMALSLFRAGPNFALSNLSALLSYAATFAVSYLLSIYLQQVKGLGADVSGLVLVVAPACQAVVAPLAGRWSDRRSPFALASLGMCLCTVGLVALALIGKETPLAWVLACLVVTGCGFGLFSTPNTNAIMSLAQPRDFGVVVAFVATMRNLGMVVSMAIITIIVSQRFGGAAIAEAPSGLVLGTMRIAFWVFAGICLAGVVTSLQRRRPSPSSRA